ncbi:glycine cleavage system protein R [Zooshikella ganghwensis]|uniref:Glycine cleavage system transcriptional repressor n=1 Tax=Zooshikella ganghwensis TaxID=202772 RepID=A0A4P9VGU8_9GAMM|nr:ACT domain-containing protein [Zooshikella ganghwensis]RDH42388.1 glycine cleavage system protein R [Zooshikella ganghwensis]
MAEVVITLLAPDRPGIIETISQVIAAHEGNWLDSKLSLFNGQFAGIAHIYVPNKYLSSLTEQFNQLSAQKIAIHQAIIDQTSNSTLEAEVEQEKVYTLHLLGNDRPGIVRDITKILLGFKINITNLETEHTSAPMSNEAIFKASAILRIPLDANIDLIKSGLEKLANELIVDITLDNEN